MPLEHIPQLRKQANELFERQDVPGMGIAVVDGSETDFSTGLGHRQLDPTAPATTHTLWGIGSATKPITATAVLKLVDDGKIDLNDPVSSYVPYFEDAPGKPITVHDLLTHTSGMPSDDSATLVLLRETFDVEVQPILDDWEAFRQYVNESVYRRRLDSTRCLYYNSGYVILSRLVESVSGESFADVVQETVLDPLGMDDSTFDVGVLDDDSHNAMTPYYEEEGEMVSAALPDNPMFQAPGGLLTSVTDLVTFLSACNNRSLPIESSLFDAMLEPVGTFRELVDGTEYGYGCGWMIRPFGDDVLIGHAGGTGVSAGYLGWLRERGLGIAIGCNAQPDTSPEEMAVELLATLTRTEPASVLPERAIERKANRITGQYESYNGIQQATVRWTGDRLEIDYTNPMGGDSLQLSPTSFDLSDYTFRQIRGNGQKVDIEFHPDDEGVEFLLNRVLYERVEGLNDDD